MGETPTSWIACSPKFSLRITSGGLPHIFSGFSAIEKFNYLFLAKKECECQCRVRIENAGCGIAMVFCFEVIGAKQPGQDDGEYSIVCPYG